MRRTDFWSSCGHRAHSTVWALSASSCASLLGASGLLRARPICGFWVWDAAGPGWAHMGPLYPDLNLGGVRRGSSRAAGVCLLLGPASLRDESVKE